MELLVRLLLFLALLTGIALLAWQVSPFRAKRTSRLVWMCRWAAFGFLAGIVVGVALDGAALVFLPLTSAKDGAPVQGLGGSAAGLAFLFLFAGFVIGLFDFDRVPAAPKSPPPARVPKVVPLPATPPQTAPDLPSCAVCGATDDSVTAIRVGNSSVTPPLCAACRNPESAPPPPPEPPQPPQPEPSSQPCIRCGKMDATVVSFRAGGTFPGPPICLACRAAAKA